MIKGVVIEKKKEERKDSDPKQKPILKKIPPKRNIRKDIALFFQRLQLSRRTKKIVIISASLLVLALVIILMYLFLRIKVCEDNKTIYNKCSVIKPYYCNGKIIENASYCGCDNITKQNGNLCISNYQQQPKNISLNYFIDGRKREINFTVYKNLSDYLFSLPMSIYYSAGQKTSNADFILRDLNNQEQQELLYPLVLKIQSISKDETEQARIAISIVQNIKYGSSDKKTNFGTYTINYSRYPYQVLYDSEGICGEKSELLAYLLKEIGYNVVIFSFPFENHEAVGVKCPTEYSYRQTGYCFIETTGPAIISDGGIYYANIGKLYSTPDLIFVSDGKSFSNDLYEYSDALELKSLRDSSNNMGGLDILQNLQYQGLKKKYGLQEIYNAE
ncbi:MAG TPA: hypothetical protein VMC80_03035 [Patescibacteria group bacterium]|nr:hypothetical protein [Patescibacteria group bacterium]